MRALPVDGSLVEALLRLLPRDTATVQRLAALGLDPDTAGKTRFTAEQWRTAVELARDVLFGADLATGYRRLGHALATAYGSTLAGKLMVLALPMLSPMQLLRRWPRFVRVGRTDVELDVTEVDERCVVITSRDPVDVPMELNLGLLDFVFEALGHRPRYEVATLPGGEVAVTIRW